MYFWGNYYGERALFVYNPYAGKAQIKNYIINIMDTIVKGGYELNVHPSQNREDIKSTVSQKAGNFDLLILSGGDGTLNEGVQGIMEIPEERRPLIGYIPAGTTNDFASSVGISKDMASAALDIVSGEVFKCDIGSFNEKHFVYVAAFGAFTDVAYDTPQKYKNLLGHMAYILNGIIKLPSIKSEHIKIKSGEGEIEGDFIFGMISNSMSVGGMKSVAGNDVGLDDGVFEVLLIKMPESVNQIKDIVKNIITGDFSNDSFVSFKTDRLEIISQNNIDWTLDGEFGGSVNEVKIENKHQAISILVGDSEKRKEIRKTLMEGDSLFLSSMNTMLQSMTRRMLPLRRLFGF